MWKKIDKSVTVQPATGTYRDWKELLAVEAGHQCVYCAIREASFGGTRNFHVEHFRPRSRFADLCNDIRNLFYACCICNGFKGNEWPCEPTDTLDSFSFIDPSLWDYGEIFGVDAETARLEADRPAGAYMIERLYLNRAQLLVERRLRFVLDALMAANAAIREDVASLRRLRSADAVELLARLVLWLNRMSELQIILGQLRPYTEAEIRRTQT